uniref:Uncharacterized protein n=1 Tax=Salarias fasciatus TaxID=181472 RepID=A0A672GXP0_SALFA
IWVRFNSLKPKPSGGKNLCLNWYFFLLSLDTLSAAPAPLSNLRADLWSQQPSVAALICSLMK